MASCLTLRYAGKCGSTIGSVRDDRMIPCITANVTRFPMSRHFDISRLHKPVRVIHGSVEAEPAIQHNLASAVKAALLLLPEGFSAAQFYTTIAGLSYTGASLLRARLGIRQRL